MVKLRLAVTRTFVAATLTVAALAVGSGSTPTGRTEVPAVRYGTLRPGPVATVEPAEVLPEATKAEPPANVEVPARSGMSFWAWAANPVVATEPRPASSLTATYTATAEMLCWAHRGAKPTPCALPAGTSGIIRWGVVPLIGPHESLPTCNTSISAADPVSTCRVTWPAAGDQEIEAWLEIPHDKIAAGKTVTTDILAPVDLAAGQSFQEYGNGVYNDCTMAAAADYVQIATRKPLDATTLVDQYFILDHGHDDGLSDTQLFGLWEHGGIGGTFLTRSSSLPVTRGAVEGYISTTRRPLLSDVDLPVSWTGGGAHAWLIVGFSSYGPLILTWGDEIQLTWSAWHAMTTKVEALTIQKEATNDNHRRLQP